MIAAGDLDELVTVEAVTRTADGQGGYTEAWTTHTRMWARIEPLNGSEQLQAMALQSRVTHRMEARFMAGILPGMRIKRQSGAILKFRGGILTTGRSEGMTAMLEEDADSGTTIEH